MRFRSCRFFCFLLFISAGAGVFAQAASGYSAFMAQAAVKAASMSNSGLAAQVLLTGIDGKLGLAPAMKVLLEKIPAGGIMLFRYNLDSSPDEVRKLLAETAGLVEGRGGIAPFMAVDHEGGLVHRFGQGVERLPSAFSFWELAQREGRAAALERAGTLYRRSAAEIRGLGITMVLSPVAETLNEENRLFLDTRSYGPDPDFTRAAASIFIESMNASGIASVVKHFPGNTAADPHSAASILRADKDALDEMVKPFAGIIRGIDPPAVLVSHVLVPALDNKKIASLSRPVIEGWLRGELGFKGIALADDFSMAAAGQGTAGSGTAGPGPVAVEALNAGVDMIIVWPRNITSVHSAILDALASGRLSRERLLEAAGRIIAVKMRYGLVSVP